jgi:hypothetical protein
MRVSHQELAENQQEITRPTSICSKPGILCVNVGRRGGGGTRITIGIYNE